MMRKDPSDFDSLKTEDVQIFKCSVCNLIFLGKQKFQAHVESLEHAKMILQTASSSRNRASSADLEENELIAGITSSQRPTLGDGNKTLEEQIGLPSRAECNNNITSFAHCELCKKNFSGPEPHRQHLASAAHKKKVDMQNASITGAVASDLTNTLICKPCGKQFSGPVPYEQHLKSDAHRKMCNEAAPKALPTVLFCEICNKQFSGPFPFDQHMKSDVHKKRVRNQQLLESLRAQGALVTCNMESEPKPLNDPMSDNVPVPKPQNQFLNDNAHQTQYDSANIIPDWYCTTCNKQCSGPIPYNDHLVSNIHKKNLMKAEWENKFLQQQNSEDAINSSAAALQEVVQFPIVSSTEKVNPLSQEIFGQQVNIIGKQEKNESKEVEKMDLDIDLPTGLGKLNLLTINDLNVSFFGPHEKIDFDSKSKNKTEETNIVDSDEISEENDI